MTATHLTAHTEAHTITKHKLYWGQKEALYHTSAQLTLLYSPDMNQENHLLSNTGYISDQQTTTGSGSIKIGIYLIYIYVLLYLLFTYSALTAGES